MHKYTWKHIDIVRERTANINNLCDTANAEILCYGKLNN